MYKIEKKGEICKLKGFKKAKGISNYNYCFINSCWSKYCDIDWR